MNPEFNSFNSIKTTDDILLNHTHVEVSDGIYINNSLVKLFKNIERDLSFVKIDEENHIRCAVYEYFMTPDLSINLYTNAKHNYLELVHFYDIPEFYDKHFLEIINIINRSLTHTKAVSNFDDLSIVEVSSVYSGEFAPKAFLKFLSSYHSDILNFHKINNMYMTSLTGEMKRLEKEDIIQKSINKSLKILNKQDLTKTESQKTKIENSKDKQEVKSEKRKLQDIKNRNTKEENIRKTKIAKVKVSPDIKKVSSKKEKRENLK